MKYAVQRETTTHRFIVGFLTRVGEIRRVITISIA